MLPLAFPARGRVEICRSVQLTRKAHAMEKARRGDIVVIHCKDRIFVIGQSEYDRDTYRVGLVTNITRDGLVKGFTSAHYSGSTVEKIDLKSPRSRDKPVGFVDLKLVSQDMIDVPAALEAARKNPWPHNGAPGKYFESLKEVKAALKPHLRTANA